MRIQPCVCLCLNGGVQINMCVFVNGVMWRWRRICGGENDRYKYRVWPNLVSF